MARPALCAVSEEAGDSNRHKPPAHRVSSQTACSRASARASAASSRADSSAAAAPPCAAADSTAAAACSWRAGGGCGRRADRCKCASPHQPASTLLQACRTNQRPSSVWGERHAHRAWLCARCGGAEKYIHPCRSHQPSMWAHCTRLRLRGGRLRARAPPRLGACVRLCALGRHGVRGRMRGPQLGAQRRQLGVARGRRRMEARQRGLGLLRALRAAHTLPYAGTLVTGGGSGRRALEQTRAGGTQAARCRPIERWCSLGRQVAHEH